MTQCHMTTCHIESCDLFLIRKELLVMPTDTFFTCRQKTKRILNAAKKNSQDCR